MSFENLISPSRRQESAGLYGGVLRLDWASFIIKPKLVYRPCDCKIQNAVQLYNFFEKAVSAKAEEDLTGKQGAKIKPNKRFL